MNKVFDFDAIGKRTPYRTPESFFEQMQIETLKRVKEEKRRKKLYRLRWRISFALAVAAMVCGLVFFSTHPETNQNENVTNWLATNADMQDVLDSYLQGLSDEDLEDWIEFSENDIYYELTTENFDEDEN